MNRWLVLAAVWLLVVIQVSFLAWLAPWGVVPQLSLVGLLFVAALRSVSLTLITAVWTVFWLGVYSPVFSPGLYIVTIGVAGLWLAARRLGLDLTKPGWQLAALAAGSLAINGWLIVWLIQADMAATRGLGWIRLISLEVLLTWAMALLLRPLLKLIATTNN